MEHALGNVRKAKTLREAAEQEVELSVTGPAPAEEGTPRQARRLSTLGHSGRSKSFVLHTVSEADKRRQRGHTGILSLSMWIRYVPTLLLFAPLALVLIVSAPVHISTDAECGAVGASDDIIVGLGGGALAVVLLTQLVSYGQLEAKFHKQLKARGLESVAELAILDLVVLVTFALAFMLDWPDEVAVVLLLGGRATRLLLALGLARLHPFEAHTRHRIFISGGVLLAAAGVVLALDGSIQLVRLLALFSSAAGAMAMLRVTQHAVKLHDAVPFKKHFVLACSLLTQGFVLQVMGSAADFVDAGLNDDIDLSQNVVTIELFSILSSVRDLLPHMTLQAYLARHISGANHLFHAGGKLSQWGLALLVCVVVGLAGMWQAHTTCVSPLGQCATTGAAAFVTRFGVGCMEVMLPLIFLSVCPAVLSVVDRQRIGPVMPRVRGSLVPVHKALSLLLVLAIACHVYGHLTIRANADAIADCMAPVASETTMGYLTAEHMERSWPWVTGGLLLLCMGVCLASGVLRGAGCLPHPTFLAMHKLAASAALPLLVMHGLGEVLASAKMYLFVLATAVLWLVGLAATDSKATAAQLTVHRSKRSSVVVVRFPMPFGLSPGMWVLARCPEIDSIAHPFTLAGSPDDDGYGELHVGTTPNPRGWTQRLAQLPEGHDVTFYFEGPFRSDLSNPNLWRSDRVLFVVSSTGFTALDAWITALRQSPDREERFEQLYVLFMTSSVEPYLERCAETLGELPAGHVFSSYPMQFAETVRYTGSGVGATADEKAQHKTQNRVEQVLERAFKGQLDPLSTISVAICGRSLVARGAQQAAKEFRSQQWTFEWFTECFDS